MSKIRISLAPTESMWKWWRGEITPLSVVSSIADKQAGYHISSSANALLKDLNLLTAKGNVNKEAKDILATYLHYKFHANGHDAIAVINPTKANGCQHSIGENNEKTNN